jgi:transcriptional accessory protein Tex/SPT6
VGADINAMSSQTWRQPQLQFIPGLGPRKAGALIKALSGKDSHVYSRLELRTPSDPYAESRPCAVLGTKVFMNAAPFVRVRAGDVAALANSDMDLQDDTRIHPEMEVALGWLCEETMPQADADHIRAVIEEGRQELERVRGSGEGQLGGGGREMVGGGGCHDPMASLS